ncbi:hypothetical protein Tco_0126241, partial [Tanacetum coccineum]
MAFMLSPSSTNEVNTAYEANTAKIQVSPANTQVSTASTQISTASIRQEGFSKRLVERSLSMGVIQLDMTSPSSKRTINVEDTSSKAMLAIDGVGFDWSYMADDEVLTSMALMDFSESE